MANADQTRYPANALTLDSVLEAARRKTRLSKWGNDEFRQPLRTLLAAANEEAQLTEPGRIGIHRAVVHRLCNKLELNEFVSRNPRITQVTVPPPTIITGFARTGTTFLQGLLANDPAFRTFQRWELFRPLPPPDRESYDADPRRAQLAAYRTRVLSLQQQAAIERLHEAGPGEYEECYVILEHSFLSRSFLLYMRLPSYERWLATQDMTPAYREHFRWMQVLLSQLSSERLLLKAPQHLANLAAIFAIYPDAKIIWTHRSLASVVPSNCSLLTLVRGLRSASVNRFQVGQECLDSLAAISERAIAARSSLASHSFCDVAFRDLCADPIAVVRKVYAQFNFKLTGDTVEKMKAWLLRAQERPRSTHRYDLAQFGLEADQIPDRLSAYCAQFADYISG